MSQHKCVGSKNGGRSRRGSVNGNEGADCRELAVDFLFLNIEEASDVLNHLFVGKSHFVAGRTIWRRRSDKVGGVASTIDGRG